MRNCRAEYSIAAEHDRVSQMLQSWSHVSLAVGDEALARIEGAEYPLPLLGSLLRGPWTPPLSEVDATAMLASLMSSCGVERAHVDNIRAGPVTGQDYIPW